MHSPVPLKTVLFFVALFLSGCIHLMVVVCLWALEGYSPPRPMLPLGNSDVLGMAVETISDNPGSLSDGPENAPGGNYQPEDIVRETPREKQPPIRELQPESPAPKMAIPDPDPREEMPVLALTPLRPETVLEQADVTIPVAAAPPLRATESKPATTSSVPPSDNAKAGGPGAPGGSNLPRGTPSAGGIVGVPNGVPRPGLKKPTYPPEALARGIEGKVMVQVRIAADGSVLDTQVHQSSGSKILDESALKDVRGMKFYPAYQGTTGMEATVLYPINYSITRR